MIEQILKKYGQHGVQPPSGWSMAPATGTAAGGAAPAPMPFGQAPAAAAATAGAPVGFGQVRGALVAFVSCVWLTRDPAAFFPKTVCGRERFDGAPPSVDPVFFREGLISVKVLAGGLMSLLAQEARRTFGLLCLLCAGSSSIHLRTPFLDINLRSSRKFLWSSCRCCRWFLPKLYVSFPGRNR